MAVAVGTGLCGGEPGGHEELLLVGGEVLVCLEGAPFVLDSRRELAGEDVDGVVLFGGGGVGVRGEIHEQHYVPTEVLDGGHVFADMGEKDGGRLFVAIPCCCDRIV